MFAAFVRRGDLGVSSIGVLYELGSWQDTNDTLETFNFVVIKEETIHWAGTKDVKGYRELEP